MTLAVRFIPEGNYSSEDLKEFAKEFRQYLGTNEVMDRETVAAFLGMTASNVDKLTRKGDLRYHYLGTSKRFLKEEVIEDIRRSKRTK